MSEGRHKFEPEDELILDRMKLALSEGIWELQASGLRNANIEIELMWHIRKTLKGE